MRFSAPALLLATAALASGCDTSTGPSLYDPIQAGAYQTRPDPVVTSVAPDAGTPLIGTSYVAGLTTLTITGSNFNPSLDSTFVYVGGKRVTPISVTATQIRVRVPNLPGDAVPVQVSVLRATNFARPSAPFVIKTAFTRWGELAVANTVFGVATDPSASVGYASLNLGAVSQGIVRVTGATPPTPSITTTFQWPELGFFDNQVYGVRGVQAIFRFTIPATAQQVWANLSDNRISLRAIDVDPQGTVWTGGLNTNPDATQRGFYRIDQAKVVTLTPFDGEVTAIEKAGNTLFVAGTRGTTRGIWRYAVAANGAVSGEAQLVAFTGEYATLTPNALAVTASGDVLVGSDYKEPVLRVSPAGAIVSHYPGLLSGTVTAMRWLNDTQLLISGARILSDAKSVAGPGDLIVAESFRTAQL